MKQCIDLIPDGEHCFDLSDIIIGAVGMAYTFLLFYYKKNVYAIHFTILLFYYFTTFYYILLFYYFTTFYYFTFYYILLHFTTFYYLLFYYFTTFYYFYYFTHFTIGNVLAVKCCI